MSEKNNQNNVPTALVSSHIPGILNAVSCCLLNAHSVRLYSIASGNTHSATTCLMLNWEVLLLHYYMSCVIFTHVNNMPYI